MSVSSLSLQTGFTLIELLVVTVILAVLLAITLIAINPARQFSAANDIQRRNDVNAILNAVQHHIVSNKGALPPGIAAGDTEKEVSSGGTGEDFCNALVPVYIASLPYDPAEGYSFSDCSSYMSGYSITLSTPVASGTPRITVTAPNSELAEPDISATR